MVGTFRYMKRPPNVPHRPRGQDPMREKTPVASIKLRYVNRSSRSLLRLKPAGLYMIAPTSSAIAE
jgi:hypothetical protein